MLPTGPRGPLMEIAPHMFEGGGRPVAIEGVTLVGKREVKNAIRFQDAEMIEEGANGVLAMFEEVIGNDEVLARVSNRGQFLAIVNNVHIDERLGGEFRVLISQFVYGEAVNVLDVSRFGNR